MAYLTACKFRSRGQKKIKTKQIKSLRVKRIEKKCQKTEEEE